MDCYTAFYDLFEKIILKIHKKVDHSLKDEYKRDCRTTNKVIQHNQKLTANLLRKQELEKHWNSMQYDAMQNKIIDSIKVSIRRNLVDFNLCPGLTHNQRMKIMDIVKIAFVTIGT